MTTPILQFPFGNEQEYRDFLLYHQLDHDLIYQSIIGSGLQFQKYPLMDARYPTDTDWLNNHQLEHQEIYDVLGLSGLPDLSSVDFTKQDQFEAWHDLHRDVHTLINNTLGI